jgi:uncharacterized protein
MRSIVSLALAVSAALAVVAPGARAQQVQVSPANRTIAITTTDTAERRAEVANLSIGFQVFGPDSTTVYTQGARISEAVAAALAKLGVPRDSISSVSQSTGPTQEFNNREISPAEQAARRFQAEQSWTVKTTPDAVAKVLAAAVAAGANQSGNVDWTVTDEGALSTEAATKALAHAKAIATQMAQNLGATVSKLLYASNQAEQIQPRMLMAPRAMMEGKGGGGGGGVPTLNLSAPMITRSATVSAIFAIE